MIQSDRLFPAYAGAIQKRNGWGVQNTFSDILRILFFLRKAKAATLFIQSNQVAAFCMCEILMIYSDVLRFFLELGLDHQVDILGSPPRMRGKGKPGPVKLAASGITHACAGKS